MPHTTNQDAQKGIEPLAIVGLALRYPGDANTSDEFWKLMMDRRCASTKVPSDRLNVDAHHHPDTSRHDSLSVNGGHFISGDISAFDSAFFSIPPAEAEGMDPQQRIMLETTYQAFENAGISLEKASGSQTCVFTGCSSNDYATLYSKDPQNGGKYSAYGQAMNMTANRLSWFYNLKGPSLNVDTACSSGLVALDAACQSIWSGVSTSGLVVGANLIFAREFSNSLDNLGVLSPDNRCFTFDERANGYGRGEGVGAVVIKPVKDAIRDGDTIRAVVRSTRSNQDGRTPGITQPDREAQRVLIEDSYLQAGLDPATTRYFEAHGTGTSTGDPIEMRAIGTVFKQHRSPEHPLYVGSVKSNIGHQESGSGIAALIKVILSLEKGVIPPVSDNFHSVNPAIDVEYYNLKVVSSPVIWPTGLRRASINSFGFGGTNSHVILDDALHFLESQALTANHTSCAHPSLEQQPTNGFATNGSLVVSAHTNGIHTNGTHVNGTHVNGSHANGSHPNGEKPDYRSFLNADNHNRIITWSASDDAGIERLAQVWKDYFNHVSVAAKGSETYINDLAHTLNQRRSHLPWMTYALVDTNTKFDGIVESWKAPVRRQESHNMAYVFSGQGAQWAAMGCELLSRYQVYRQNLVEAGQYLRSLGCEWDLLDELQKSEEKSLVNDPTLAQPLCTAIQIALVDLLSSFGIEPSTVIGHSSGEIAAAYCAHSISREYAWRLAYFRGLWAANLATSSSMDGAMMAVALSAEQVQSFLDRLNDEGKQQRVSVACVNSPRSVTLSGERSQINKLHSMFQEQEIMAKVLPIPVAYHSFQMEEIAIAYRESVGDDAKRPLLSPEYHSPQMISSVDGEWVDGERLSRAEYWVSNLLSTVQFLNAFKKLSAAHPGPLTKKLDGSHRKRIVIDTIVEIGPHAAMRGPSRDILREAGRNMQVQYLSALMRNTCGVQTLLQTMAQLRCMGFPVNLCIVNSKPSKATKKQPKVLTDVPSYQFNKSKSYWREGTISKSFRFRRFGRHELLGWPDYDWNPLLPKWNNVLQPSDPVWVKDHQLNNTILLPGAAMLAMSMEAMKQLQTVDKEISGFNFKNVSFMSALVVPATNTGVETRFCMRPQRDDESDNAWYEFTLYSSNGSWVKNCTGNIQAVVGKPHESASHATESTSLETTAALDELHEMKDHATTVLNPADFYESLKRSKLQFGPSFEVIESVATNQVDRSIMEIKTYRSGSPARWNEAYTIHPTTLDGLMQSTQLLRSQAGHRRIPASIPIRLDRAWISNTGLNASSTPSIKVGTKLRHEGRQESTFNITGVGHATEEVLMRVEGVTFKAIDFQHSTHDESSPQSSKCHRIEWKPDLDLMNETSILKLFKDSVSETTGLGCHYLNMELMITGFISRAESALLERGKENDALAQVQPYMDWMKRHVELNQIGKSPFSSEYWQERIRGEDEFLELCTSVEEASQQGKMLANIGRSLVKYSRGEGEGQLSHIVDVEQVEGSYEQLFENAPGALRWRAYMDTLSHKHPEMRILEVDGSAGSASHLLMNTLAPRRPGGHIIPRFAHFEIANSDQGRLSALQMRLGDSSPRVSFKQLDVGGNLGSEVLEDNKYDLVVICLAFHQFASIEKCLANIRSMLAERGKLVIIDMVNPEAGRSAFVNGLDESWWINSEDYRSGGHCIGESKWNELLRQSGFSGSDLVFRDHDDLACHEVSIIVSTSVPGSSVDVDHINPPVAILLDPTQPSQQGLAQELDSELQRTFAHSVELWSIKEALPTPIPKDLICVVLLEFENPLLADMDENLFQKLQYLAGGCRKVLWVSSNGGTKESPFNRVVDGLFRVLNSEDSRSTFTTLSIENAAFQVNHITRVLKAMDSYPNPETEYVERSGLLQIPRLVEAPRLSNAVSRLRSSKYPARLNWNSTPPLKLAVGSGGTLDGLQFIEDMDRSSPLPADMLEIKVRAVGANFRDVLVMLGRMDQTTLGFECAGIVTRVGKNCTDFQIGDQVVGCNHDSYRTYARLHQAAAIRIPSGISFSHAAAIPTNFVTAWHSLVCIANVQPNETVLIHSGAGGTGQAAIQVAQYLGAKVIATVGNEEKKKFLIDRYDIPESHIFSSRNTDFAAGIRRLTKGQGVDTVLNSLSGEGLLASWESIAPYGRFLEIGKRDILAHGQLDMYHFARNVTFSAVDLALVVQERPHLIGKALRALMPLFSTGTLRVSGPLRVHGIDELETGFRTLQGGQSSGKIVFEMCGHELVDTMITPQSSHSFDPNATYIIAGGLGGLGKSIVRWMVGTGARNLLLLSRSGAQSRDSQAFMRELARNDVTALAPPCDITNRSMLEAVLGDVSYSMPPIKGFIQATVVLQDAMFQQMTHSQWVQATTPKIAGTWNMHQLLPSGLDFFIMLSSISSIMGNRGQANYAAANGFMDALAHHRMAHGENSTSLNLGFFLSTGLVAQSTSLKDRYTSKLPFDPVTEVELHALLSLHCDPCTPRSNENGCQTIFGITTPQDVYKSNPDAIYWLEKPAFRHILAVDHAEGAGGGSPEQHNHSQAGKSLSSADSVETAGALLTGLLVSKLSKTLGVPEEEIHGERPLHSYGVDSLVAVELRNWFFKEFDADVAIFDMLGGTTIAAVGHLAAGKVFAKRQN